MNIVLKENIVPNIEELICLYKNVGWVSYTHNSDMLKASYENSLKIISAWDDNKLIGIGRVVGDGYSIIYIQDLLVLREYQRMGIGSKILQMIMKQYETVYQKVLLTEDQPNTTQFYETCGFKKSSEFGCISFVNYNINENVG